MRSPKGSHLITVQNSQYRWRATGGDGHISVSIWPVNNIGPFISGIFDYHQASTKNIDGSHSLADQIIVTSRLVRRVIEHVITAHHYNPDKKGKELHLGHLENVIRWDDAIRVSDMIESESERPLRR